jgi:hypothetical protein
MRTWIILLAGLSLAAPAPAREVQLTVYNNDLGLVRDVRDLDLQNGRGSVSIVDVAAQIDPTSVHLKSLSREGGITVLEQNYRYDLASPDRILERYLDSAIEAVLEGGDLHQGREGALDPPAGEGDRSSLPEPARGAHHEADTRLGHPGG